MNEEDVEEEEEDGNDDNYDNANGKDNDADINKHHDSRWDKGSNNTKSMASLLAEICRGSDKHVLGRGPADDPSSDKMARSAHVSNSGR